MDWIPQIFRRRKIYNDLSEEIRLHMEERTEQLMREGMSPKEAKQAAHLAFGNRTVVEERSREVWQWPTLESIVADVRFALRQLRKSPGFTIAAVLTLALAIGANAVVFGIMDGLVLRPLNVLQVESLYGTHYGDNPTWQSYPNYIDLRNRNHSFEDMSAFNMVLGVGFDTGKESLCRKRLCSDRQLLRRAAHSPLSWPFLARIRRTRPRQRSVYCAHLRILARPVPRRSRRGGPPCSTR